MAADIYTDTQTNTRAVLNKKTHSFTQKPIYRCIHMPSYSGRHTHTFMYTQINSHKPTHALTQSYTFIFTYIHKFTCSYTQSHSYIYKHPTCDPWRGPPTRGDEVVRAATNLVGRH